MLGCHLCEGKSGRKECPECGGRGHLRFETCPVADAFADPGVPLFLRCESVLQSHGILPAQGGLLDQSNRFLEMLAWSTRVRRMFRDEDC